MFAELFEVIGEILCGSFIYTLKAFLALLSLPWDYSFNGLHYRAALSLCIGVLLTDCYGIQAVNLYSVSNAVLNGVLVGMVLWSPFYVAEMLGDLADSLRGQNMAAFYDHNLQVSANVSSMLLKYASLAFIFQNNFTDKFFYFINFNLSWSAGVTELFRQLINLLQQVFLYVFPFAVLVLCVQLVIVLLNKLSPQQNFFAESFLLQSILYVVFGYGLISKLSI